MSTRNVFEPPKAEVMPAGEGHPAHPGGLEIVEIDFNRSMSIWWSLTWRAVLVGGLAGVVFGAVAGALSAVAGHPELSAVAGGWAGKIGSVPVSMWALFAALKRKHAGLSVAMVRSV